MRRLVLGLVLAAFFGAALQGQNPQAPPKGKQTESRPAKSITPDAVFASKKSQDWLGKLTDKQRFFYLSGQRGLEWLQKANRPDGRFVYGFLPALSTPMESDSFLGQGSAAMALARAAKFYKDERSTAIAKQALLTLLLETATDAQNPEIRYSAAPPQLVDRPSATAMLMLAIHELDSPAKDLLDKADQMANYLHKLVQGDGTLNLTEGEKTSGAAIQHNSGPVLYAIIRSQHLRPGAWKLDLLRKARTNYIAYWRQNKNAPMVPGHSGAYAEAFLLTKEQAFADAVFEMNDWLCDFQYQDVDRMRSRWTGGFQQWVDGKAVQLAPDVGSAQYAESLAEACRVAKAAGDVQRFQRYRLALENTLKFLTTIQYNEASARHFTDWFRPAVVGGFHASLQDGNLRVDQCAHALSALVLYLNHVAELP